MQMIQMEMPADVYQMELFLYLQKDASKQEKKISRLLLLMTVGFQIFSLGIMLSDQFASSQYYQTTHTRYVLLRYVLVLITFFLFEKDVISVKISIRIIYEYRE
jgi:hypothetical protein